VIVWTEQAARQLDQAQEYVALSNSEQVAIRIAVRIAASVQQLATFPLLGRTGRVPGTRELVIPGTPFIVAYTVENDRIVILALYHGAQRWPEAF
jgi:addiction module RelE/StbE family toxin